MFMGGQARVKTVTQSPGITLSDNTCIMIKVFNLLLMPVLILGLRVSDAWVSDIERLKPATSNRIETFVFPTKNIIREVMEYPSLRGNTDEMSFEPLYFKFRHKLNGEVQESIPIPAGETRKKLPKLHPRRRGTEDF